MSNTNPANCCSSDDCCTPGAASATTIAGTTRSSEAVFQPGVDIIESPTEYTIRTDVPGATADGIDVNFEEGVLTVRAAVGTRQPNDTPFLIREYGVGDYERSFRIRADIDADKISAEIKHGVLTLHLPKPDEAKPRKIAVATNN